MGPKIGKYNPYKIAKDSQVMGKLSIHFVLWKNYLYLFLEDC